jgi:hypothetical protein
MLVGIDMVVVESYTLRPNGRAGWTADNITMTTHRYQDREPAVSSATSRDRQAATVEDYIAIGSPVTAGLAHGPA